MSLPQFIKNAIALGLTPANLARSSAPYVYNADPLSLLHIRGKMAAAMARKGRAKILWFGNSQTAGKGADGAANWTNGKTLHSPAALAKMLAAAGYPVVSSSFCGDGGIGGTLYPTYNTQVTYSGGWGASQTALGGACLRNTSDTATLALATSSAELIDSFDVYSIRNSGLGTFTLNIDGGSTLATPNMSGTAALIKTTVGQSAGTTTTNTNHTLNIARTTGGGVYMAAVLPFSSVTGGVEIITAGMDGITISGMAAAVNPYDSLNVLQAIQPDLTIFGEMINSYAGSITGAAWTAQAQAIVTAARLTGDVIMMADPPASNSAFALAGQASMLATVKGFAASNAIPFISTMERMGSYTATQPLGWWFDTKHPTYVGYYDIARPIAALLRRS